jgi:succinate dehydrogenase flavin-adding protein (antitoxin of CptAB toxin-antitoxin module)
MSIAVDQQRLRRIVETLLPSGKLGRAEATTMLQFVQLAAGVDDVDDPIEHSIVQSIAQTVSSLAGLRMGEMHSIPPIPDKPARLQWLHSLGAQLTSRGVRELTYALTFLTTVADLQLTSMERDALDEFQHALELEDPRVTDLIVFVTSVVAESDVVAQT